MPEHMKRREAVYYFRRVVPKDLQAAGDPREICRSLKTRDFAEAKRRLHIENVRFDEWVRTRRAALSDTRQMAPANENHRAPTFAETVEYGFESEPHYEDEDNELPYDQWVIERERLHRQQDAEFLAEERQSRTVPLRTLFDDYARSARLAAATAKQWRVVIDHLIGFLGQLSQHS